jgi:hypothetical protein
MNGCIFLPAYELVSVIDPPRPPATRCGADAMTVFQTPVTLMSMVSWKAPGWSRPRSPGWRARVGHDDVEPTELGHPGVDEGLHVVEVPHVALVGEHAAAECLDESRGLLQVLGSDRVVRHTWQGAGEVEGEDVGTLAGELDGVRPTLPTGSAGDECDLACEAVGSFHGHGVLLLCGVEPAPGWAPESVVARRRGR